MKNKRSALIAAIFILLMLACRIPALPENPGASNMPTLTPTVVLENSSNTQITDSLSKSQIIIVMDISGSMVTRVIPNPPPSQLSNLLTRINEIEDDPEIKKLSDKLKAILEEPDIKDASEKLSVARYERLQYIQDTMGIDLFDLVNNLEEKLLSYNCQDYLATYMVEAASVKDALGYLESNCPSLLKDKRTEIAAQIRFLDNEALLEKVAGIKKLEAAYNQRLDNTDYSQLDKKRSNLYQQKNYSELSQELDTTAKDLGLPSRLDFAKAAASSILDLIELDHRVSGRSQQVGLVVFETYAKMLQPLTDDTESARAIISKLSDQNTTNLGGGLEIALQMAEESPNPTTIILLSDGWSNTGPSRDTIMQTLGNRAKAQGVRICSTGFGTKEEDIDAELLKSLADSSGGKYLFTSSGGELVSFFISCRQSTVAENVLQLQGQIKPGEVVEAGQFEMPANNGELTLSLNYIDDNLNLVITDPSGNRVTPDYPGLTQSTSNGLQLWTFKNPEGGVWTVSVEASQADKGAGIYYVVISSKPGTTPTEEPPVASSTPIGIWLVSGAGVLFCGTGLVVFAIALIFYLRRRKK